jgi:hypothetical protein
VGNSLILQQEEKEEKVMNIPLSRNLKRILTAVKKIYV